MDSSKIAEAVPIQPKGELDSFGGNLAAVLDYIRDRDEESFNSLRTELRRWLPEYDAIIFHTPQPGVRSFQLRQAASGSLISARNLSDGTLIALCLLTLAYHPEPPTLVGLEEPDKGLHPRLLREVRDALYRLAFPDQFGIHRDPVQVIATTHSPLFLDLFQDHPEQIVISEKQADGTAKFKNLSEDAQLREIIGDAPLGDVWYSGVLGGVPVLK